MVAKPSQSDAASANQADKSGAAETEFEPQVYEVSGEQLLAARLPRDEASEGWVRLFDGHTLFGWDLVGTAQWRIDQQTIGVDRGQSGRLLTAMPWKNYQLQLQYRSPNEPSRASVLLQSSLNASPEEEQYEVMLFDNDEEGYSLGSLRGRQKAKPESVTDSTDWRSIDIVVDGSEISVKIDDALVCQYTAQTPIKPGRIGLSYQAGAIEFRDVRLRPLGLESLLDDSLSHWKADPEKPKVFQIGEEGLLQIQGGPAQLETKESYGDFVFLTQYQLLSPDANSGVFFRCIPGEKMMGYECQLSNEINDGNPLSPKDCGTGGIFRRQDARVVAGNSNDWSSVLLVVSGLSMAAWVEGVQVSQWYDDREANENPRRGARIEPGTLMIQGHDRETKANIKDIQVGGLD